MAVDGNNGDIGDVWSFIAGQRLHRDAVGIPPVSVGATGNRRPSELQLEPPRCSGSRRASKMQRERRAAELQREPPRLRAAAGGQQTT